MVCQLFTHSPVYRTGGDEFVVFLRGTDYDNRELLIANLHSLCVAHIESGEVVVSGGLPDFSENTDAKLHDVFERADASMYRKKRRSRHWAHHRASPGESLSPGRLVYGTRAGYPLPGLGLFRLAPWLAVIGMASIRKKRGDDSAATADLLLRA